MINIKSEHIAFSRAINQKLKNIVKLKLVEGLGAIKFPNGGNGNISNRLQKIFVGAGGVDIFLQLELDLMNLLCE